MTYVNLQFFSLLKDKNPLIINKIHENYTKLPFQKEIHELVIYDKSLIFWACHFENETLVQNLLSISGFQEKEHLKSCIKILYPNKNPVVLEKILESTKNLSSDCKKEIADDIFQNVAINCYREENILLIGNFLFENLSDENKNKFIEECFNRNNKSVIQYLNSNTNWHPIIKEVLSSKKEQIEKSSHKFFYTEILYGKVELKEFIKTESYTTNIIPLKTETSLPVLDKQTTKPSIVIPTIIRKKRKLVA